MMKLVCWMIVRNDGYYIDMAIKSVLPYVDGIYILDNGSVDNTINIIESFDSDKIVLKRLEYATPYGDTEGDVSILEHPYWRWDEQYDGNCLEAQTRNLCVKHCIETFNPYWLIQIDADEVYTPLFFKRLSEIDLTDITGIVHNTDRFITKYYLARNNSLYGEDRYDPHMRSWRAGFPIKWRISCAGYHVEPLPVEHIIRDKENRVFIDGIVHVHLHRMFGPKSFRFFKCYTFDQQMEDVKRVDFDWDKELPFVAQKWREWGTFTKFGYK